MWFRSDTGVHHVTPTSTREYATPSPATAISPSGLTLCVGTEDGLFRLWKGREGDKMWENPLGFKTKTWRLCRSSEMGKVDAGWQEKTVPSD